MAKRIRIEDEGLSKICGGSDPVDLQEQRPTGSAFTVDSSSSGGGSSSSGGGPGTVRLAEN